MNTKILIAGFGGQGILFAGKFLAYEGLMSEKEVSWLPSYGPEMRGGTANCSIIISDGLIGSPIVDKPDILVAMNAPSFDKYENDVPAGGAMYLDSSLIERKTARTDVNAHYIPATALAGENGLNGLANMIMLGNVIKHSGIMTMDSAKAAMEKLVPAKKQEMLGLNIRALELGYNYKGE
ncbi:MAG: 2-oxoacid:acceptor oxidoreductase family protein [Clostridia bacterium]|nr:2-oxoacid:acceptor oxidoreductase family protein [Clostridia bacterium]MBQ7012263.1 2-oxoacid:acceptor oxidoreductase family protein [Clostridia bacterium]